MHTTATGPMVDMRPHRRIAGLILSSLAAAFIGMAAGCGEPVSISTIEDLGTTLDIGAAYEAASVKEARSGDGRVTDNYEVFDLGAAGEGDQWAISINSSKGTFVLVILDDDYNLLQRERLAPGQALNHVFRHAVERVTVGVQSLDGEREFALQAAAWSGETVPEPVAQIVWLNFAGGDGVSIQGGPALSFGAFDATTLSARYAGQTQVIKDAIVRAVQYQYAGYDVIVLRSDQDPKPRQAHSTIYFGSGSNGLLGLADGVDRYNQDPADNAVVFISAFAAYSTMNLTPDEMGHMIGNIASHEFGHLLGLFHTRSEQYHLMDDSASAWDMAGLASLTRAKVSEEVFPIGMEDVEQYLTQTVGTN